MNDSRHAHATHISRVCSQTDGSSTFENVEIAYAMREGPLAMTPVLSATSISFRWTPANYDFDYHPAPRRRLIIVLEGSLEVVVSDGTARQFHVGDILEVTDTTGQGHISRSANGKDFKSAIVTLDDVVVHNRLQPIAAPTGIGQAFLRTFDAPEGVTDTIAGAWPYRQEGPSGLLTRDLAITGFQYVLAPADMNYDWHPAPQRQIVLPLTGGMEVENGKGERHAVPPGHVYVGEDTDAKGHITRALNGQRFSIFAHLAQDEIV